MPTHNRVDGTYLASRSIMVERSCLLSNIKALSINLPVAIFLGIVILEENVQQPRRFFAYKGVRKKGVVNVYCKCFCLTVIRLTHA